MLDDLTQIHDRDLQDALGMAERGLQRLANAEATHQATSPTLPNSTGESAYTLLCINAPPDLRIIAELALLAVPCTVPVVFATEFTPQQYANQTVLIVQLPLTAELDARISVFDEFQALITLLHLSGVLHETSGSVSQLLADAATQALQDAQQWQAIVSSAKNPAKRLTKELLGRSIVVQSSPQLLPVANWWGMLFGYNARQLAWPMAVHTSGGSTLAAWSQQPPNTAYAVIRLQSSFDPPLVTQAAEVAARVLSGLQPEPITIDLQGTSLLEQIVWGVHLAQYVSVYVALANGINPTPVNIQGAYNKLMEA